MEDILRLWEQVGEIPYEVLIEEGLPKLLKQFVNKQIYKHDLLAIIFMYFLPRNN